MAADGAHHCYQTQVPPVLHNIASVCYKERRFQVRGPSSRLERNPALKQTWQLPQKEHTMQKLPGSLTYNGIKKKLRWFYNDFISKSNTQRMMMHRHRLHPLGLIKNTRPLFVIQLSAKSSGTQRRTKQNLITKFYGKNTPGFWPLILQSQVNYCVAGSPCHMIQPDINCDKLHILLQVQH